jgi:hypothetical protein
VPKAIVNAENVSPVTMEEVAYRLTDALVKVVSNKGARVQTGRRGGAARTVADGLAEAAGQPAGGEL